MPVPTRLSRPETTVEACERALRAAILSGELAPGERLPPERKLAERYGVNRVTVRGALGRLASARLIRTRQGSGHVVADYLQAGGPELLGGLLSGDDDPAYVLRVVRDLLRVRRHLARGVLETLVEQGGPLETGGVREAVERFAQVAEGDFSAERMAEADVDVLAAIVELTGSPVLRLCLNPIMTVLRDMPVLREAIYALPQRNALGWQGLLAWLEAPDPEAIDLLVGFLAQGDHDTLTQIERLLGASDAGALP